MYQQLWIFTTTCPMFKTHSVLLGLIKIKLVTTTFTMFVPDKEKLLLTNLTGMAPSRYTTQIELLKFIR